MSLEIEYLDLLHKKKSLNDPAVLKFKQDHSNDLAFPDRAKVIEWAFRTSWDLSVAIDKALLADDFRHGVITIRDILLAEAKEQTIFIVYYKNLSGRGANTSEQIDRFAAEADAVDFYIKTYRQDAVILGPKGELPKPETP